MRNLTHRLSSPRFDRFIRILSLALAVSVPAGCGWHPQMFHPNAFDTGKTLPAGETEIAAQTLGTGVRVGLGAGFESRATVSLDGAHIGGIELALAKSLRIQNSRYASGCVGIEWFDASTADFTGHRLIAGLTGSAYSRSGKFGIHLPLKFYYMSYDHSSYPLEYVGPYRRDEGKGGVFVPGLGLSVEGKTVTFSAAGNLPMREKIGKIEMLPFLGFRLGVKF